MAPKASHPSPPVGKLGPEITGNRLRDGEEVRRTRDPQTEPRGLPAPTLRGWTGPGQGRAARATEPGRRPHFCALAMGLGCPRDQSQRLRAPSLTSPSSGWLQRVVQVPFAAIYKGGCSSDAGWGGVWGTTETSDPPPREARTCLQPSLPSHLQACARMMGWDPLARAQPRTQTLHPRRTGAGWGAAARCTPQLAPCGSSGLPGAPSEASGIWQLQAGLPLAGLGVPSPRRPSAHASPLQRCARAPEAQPGHARTSFCGRLEALGQIPERGAPGRSPGYPLGLAGTTSTWDEVLGCRKPEGPGGRSGGRVQPVSSLDLAASANLSRVEAAARGELVASSLQGGLNPSKPGLAERKPRHPPPVQNATGSR